MRDGGQLIEAVPEAKTRAWRPLTIQAIRCDSRQVTPGDLFVAIPGVSVDGHDYVSAALAAGAVAFVVERPLPELEGVPTAIVRDAREALAHLHAAWHDHPGRKLKVVGVTGTDGKTTTVRLIAEILRAAGHRVARIDSVSAAIDDDESPTGFHTTTPDAPEIQAFLSDMVDRGVEYAVIESTSHGLAQHRVTACEYDVAVVTNITHEHLDYHGTYEAYREAKAMLFRFLSTSERKSGVPKVAVLNADDPSYAHLSTIPADEQLTYGEAGQISARDIQVSPAVLCFTASTPDLKLPLQSPLIGRYNVHNILAAVSVAISQDIAPDAIRRGVARMSGVEGRMERIDAGQPFSVIVDFAHTPNALEKALETARDLAEGTEGKVTVVFGCAGLRDRAKRPWMGEIAGRLADRVVITAEDPRTESLDEIISEIAVGCRRAGLAEGDSFARVGDRAEALFLALEMAKAGDVVIATGKGHEKSMCFGVTEYPWSDHEALRRGLARLGYEAPNRST